MSPAEKTLELTPRFTQAVEFARQLHTEFRKGTRIPYMAHLIGVASHVLTEAGGPVPVTEAMALAAILHDTAEDHGGTRTLERIRREFGPDLGPAVARIVEGLSDSLDDEGAPKMKWEARKQLYLDRLRSEPDEVLLVSVADKLYNCAAILEDLREVGPVVFERFKRGPKEQVWYFTELRKIFEARLSNSRSLRLFQRALAELEAEIESRGLPASA